MDGIERLYAYYQKLRRLTTDSRHVPPASIFFALKGESFDGNAYAMQALDRGAEIAVVDNPELREDKRLYQVPDVLLTLQQLARYHRDQLNATIVAITGSNGKTTTKELMHAVLSTQYRCMATRGNLNNHIGVPLTLLSFPDDLEFGIVEMGANHQREIDGLCEIAHPDYGLITNVGKAHLEGFGGFEGVVTGKSEMYRYLERNGGAAFVNSNNPILMDKSKGIGERIFYGNPVDVVSGKVRSHASLLEVDCVIDQEPLSVRTRLVGDYNLENVLAAASVASYFQVDKLNIKQAIEAYAPSNNRSQVNRTAYNRLILDAYNANPSSMEAAVRNFAEADYSNKVLILGEMLELGDESNEEHSRLVTLVKKLDFQQVFFVGPGFESPQHEPDGYFVSTPDLAKHLIKNPIRGKTVLIKGSRGNRLEQLIEYL